MPRFKPNHPTNTTFPTSKPHISSPAPLFESRTPQPFRNPARLPALRSLRSYKAIHRFLDDRVKTYVEAPRSNFVATPSEAAICELREVDALPANNVDARIAFTGTVLQSLKAHPDVRRGPLHMVTICPRRCAFRVGDEGFAVRHLRAPACRGGEAANFDVRRLQALARQSLPGINFVGMVEAALWKDWGPDGPFVGDWVSWHAHLLVWGAPGAEIRAALAALKRREEPFYGSCVVDVREFDRSELIAKAVYILKAPVKHYRVGYCEREWCSEETGGIRPPGWRVNKDWMRTGDRVAPARCLCRPGPW